MSKLSVMVLTVLLTTFAAQAQEPFAWTREQKLVGKDGALTWTVKRADTETVIEGRHPKWSVTHRCAPDGTPRETVKRVGSRTSRLRWTQDGVEFTWDLADKQPPKKIAEKGLWDGDTLDARLAGLGWARGKKVAFRIVDTEKDAGDVVPMSAEYEGQEQCAAGPCHHVKLRYTGFGAVFVAPWHYHFGTGGGAPYLKFEHEKESFSAH